MEVQVLRDEHQVRTWTAWHRRVTPAMLALAFLTIAAVIALQQPVGMIPLTRNEIAHLAAVLVLQPRQDITRRLRWSAWRRRHQYRARACRCRRQAASDR